MINAIFHVQATWLPNHWLSVARATQGLSALETGLQHLCLLASAQRMGCAAAPAGARQGKADGLSLSVAIIDFQPLQTVSKGAALITGSLINWALSLFGWNMRVTKCCQQHGFEALLKRWIVERTFARLSQSRRLGKNHEVTVLFS